MLYSSDYLPLLQGHFSVSCGGWAVLERASFIVAPIDITVILNHILVEAIQDQHPDPNLEQLQPEKQSPCFFQYQDKCAATAVFLALRVPASSEFTYDLLLLLKLFLFVTYIEFYKELIRRWPPRILLR